MPGLQVFTNALPHLKTEIPWRINRIDAEQAHGPQDKRNDRCVELVACRQANTRDVAAVIDCTGKPGQVFAAKIIDRATTLRFFERAFTQIDVVADEYLSCADTL